MIGFRRESVFFFTVQGPKDTATRCCRGAPVRRGADTSASQQSSNDDSAGLDCGIGSIVFTCYKLELGANTEFVEGKEE